MILLFEEKDLVSFGNYLLSLERQALVEASDSTVPYEERFRVVYDADVANWMDKQQHPENKDA